MEKKDKPPILNKQTQHYLWLVSAIVMGGAIGFLLSETIISAQTIQKISFENWISIFGIISQFLLVLLGGLVFYQIKIAKDNIETSCIRASREKSTNLANTFAEEIIPQIEDFNTKVKRKSYGFVSHDLEDGYRARINQANSDECKLYRRDIIFLRDNGDLLQQGLHILNKFEVLAINFTKGVADEQTVFTALSQVYCKFIRDNSSLVCFLVPQNTSIFINTMDLYRVWSNRIKKEGLVLQNKDIKKQLSEFDDSDIIRPVGVGNK